MDTTEHHENMTEAEVADYARVRPETLRYWRWQGRGPKSFKLVGRVLYRRSDVEAWLEAARAESK